MYWSIVMKLCIGVDYRLQDEMKVPGSGMVAYSDKWNMNCPMLLGSYVEA